MQYNAIVTNIKDITKEIKLFSIKFKDNHKLNFKAGQFAVLALPKDENDLDGEWYRRAYSITSIPEEAELKFYVVLVSNGSLTPKLFKLNIGDDIYLGEKAAGLINFDTTDKTSNLLFISTGTGIAPFISILRGYKNDIFNNKRQVALIHGARFTYELGFKGELEDLEKTYNNFKYYPIISRSEDETGVLWNGLKGHAQLVIKDGLISKQFNAELLPDNTKVFLCGNPNMVDECVALFTEKGFIKNTFKVKGNLFFDKH